MALRDYGLAELAVAIHGLAMRGGRVHAGIHQARKAIRRTRAMLTLGGTALGPGARLVDHRRDVEPPVGRVDQHAMGRAAVADAPAGEGLLNTAKVSVRGAKPAGT